MRKIVLLLGIFVPLMADIYEEFNDFAYAKKGKNFQTSGAQILSFFKDGKKCVDLLVETERVRVLEGFDACQILENDKAFKDFLSGDFLALYQSDLANLNESLEHLKQVMRDIMVHYKLHRRLEKNMIKTARVEFLELKDEGAHLLFKINNQACVGLELFKDTGRMAMRIYGIENLDKACKFFTASPSFKSLSYTDKAFRLYYLE